MRLTHSKHAINTDTFTIINEQNKTFQFELTLEEQDGRGVH